MRFPTLAVFATLLTTSASLAFAAPAVKSHAPSAQRPPTLDPNSPDARFGPFDPAKHGACRPAVDSDCEPGFVCVQHPHSLWAKEDPVKGMCVRGPVRPGNYYEWPKAPCAHGARVKCRKRDMLKEGAKDVGAVLLCLCEVLANFSG
ncbi:hypothetical protein Hypma_004857 [Hypsizygus marmoreus]|uniref:Secreted protein n=1 Tax=Hypsizygus marmoreus TaxID=39966 RepID=A0A369J441_HYPMA|nr:hypothetical protein Hypma_004857 [Hypsizygus marmoreus]